MTASRNGARALVVVPASESDAALVASIVEELGFEAQVHRDAGSALEAVEYDRPALVVHGWDLPDMDAVTFHAAVQRRAGERALPTLAICPDDVSADRLPSRSHAIVRPYRRDTLAERVRDLASGAGVERGAARASGRPAQVAGVRVFGLGTWGIRGAEAFDSRGIPARAVDAGAAAERSSVPEERRHFVAASGDYAAASRALAADQGLARAIEADAAAGLLVVLADLSEGSGALAASLLARLADAAPAVGRLAVVRLPGVRTRPEERALALVALNAILEGAPAGILPCQPAEIASEREGDPAAAVLRLLDLLALSAGVGAEAVQPLTAAGLERFFATPGFLGWRERTLGADDMSPEGRGWSDIVTPVGWQPREFAWSEAQAVLPLARVPWSWLEGGGRRQFERFAQAAWDEAAPCASVPGLYVGDPAAAILVSAGMPYPQGLLALRDSVGADRERLAEKRRRAEAPIPLGEDFLPQGLEIVSAPPAARPRRPAAPEPRMPERPVVFEPPRPEPVEPEPEPEPIVLEPAIEIEPEPEPVALEPAIEPEPVELEPEPEPFEEPAAEFTAPAPAERPLDIEIPEPGAMPAAYEAALGLVRRVFAARDLRSEVDLSEVRYALYDLLEVMREEPLELLPEVFRPSLDEYFERHHVNVAVLALLAGDALEKSLSEVIDLGTASLLHDIGMLPTREAWDVGMKLPPKVFDRAIRPHPDLGFRRLQEITGMTGAMARMVLEEHERMDGSGYPLGQQGSGIDAGARILAVCDTLEALTHPRPYRDHVAPGAALARLQTLAEYTLDPAVVHAMTVELTRLFKDGVPEPGRR